MSVVVDGYLDGVWYVNLVLIIDLVLVLIVVVWVLGLLD